MNRLALFVFLFGIWIIFSGQLDLFHLSLGVLSAAFVSRFSANLFGQERRRTWASRGRELLRAPGYLLWLLYQIVLANIHVLCLALHPRGTQELDPQIVRVKTRLKSDFEKFALANSITLTPGTVTVKVDGEELLVHAISRKAAQSLDQEMERRIARVYETMTVG